MSGTATRTSTSPALFALVSIAILASGCVTAGTSPGVWHPSPSGHGAPTPAPTPKPTPAPTNVVNVPSSIDATGATDVSSKVQAVINGASNGSTIVFKAGGTYRLDHVLRISGRKNLTLDGNGARLDLTGSSGGYDSIGILVENYSENTTIRGFTMVGNNNQAGTSDACCSRESQHGIAVIGNTNTLIEDVDIRRVWGDCVYVNGTVSGSAPNGIEWADGVTFRDSTCRLTGRHGVGIIAGQHIRIARVHFDQIGFMVVDIEPGGSNEGATDVVIQNNTVGSYGLTDSWVSWLLEAGGANGSVIRDVTVTGNTVEGNPNGYNGAMTGLHVAIKGEKGPRSNFTVTNNTAKSAAGGPVMYFGQVSGVTVTGNTQPLSSGTLASFPGSTGVTYDG